MFDNFATPPPPSPLPLPSSGHQLFIQLTLFLGFLRFVEKENDT